MPSTVQPRADAYLTRRGRSLPNAELIRNLRPRLRCIENPQTGLLKRRPFMANLQWSNVTYCKTGILTRRPPGFGTTCCGSSSMAPAAQTLAARCLQANGGRHPALQHSQGCVQGDRFCRQCPYRQLLRCVLGFLHFSKGSATVACPTLLCNCCCSRGFALQLVGAEYLRCHRAAPQRSALVQIWRDSQYRRRSAPPLGHWRTASFSCPFSCLAAAAKS